jgi:hypothetical protein
MSLQLNNEEPPDMAYFTAWQDSKPVHFLSTFNSCLLSCKRSVRDAAGIWDTAKLYPQPSIVRVYNNSMGGTDGND